MKIWDMSSSETRREPSHRRVVLVDATRSIVPHPPPRLSRMSLLAVACSSKGESIMQEAVQSPPATWQNFYVIVGTSAATLTGLMFAVITLIAQIRVQVSSPGGGLRSSARPTSCILAPCCGFPRLSAPWPAARPCGSGRGDLYHHRVLVGATLSGGLSTGALRLAVAHGLATRRLHRPRRPGDSAPRSSGTGIVRHRGGNDAARVHRHPQHMGCRDLHGLRTLPAPEHEPGLAGFSRRWAFAGSSV